MKFQALDLHACWALMRNKESSQSFCLKSAADKIGWLVPGSDLKRVEKLALELGLIDSQGKDFRITNLGLKFLDSDHWRTWSPSDAQAAVLKRLGLYDSLLPAAKSKGAVLDLFSGVGGLGLGFEQAGFDVVAAVDNDQQACEAHSANFPHCQVIQGDISKLASDTTPLRKAARESGFQGFTGVVGGPPCQGFSYIGERFAWDERNDLTSRFVDIVLDLKPAFFLMENVEGLLSSGVRPSFSQHLKRLSDPVGAPAASLAAELPDASDAPAKRQRQFKKRAVSLFIKNAEGSLSALDRRGIESFLQKNKEASFVMSWSKGRIFDTSAELGISLNEQSWAALEKRAAKHLQTILLSLSARLLILDGVAEGDVLSLFKEGLRGDAANISKGVLREYGALKPATIFKGVKVGPIAARLIERLSDGYDVQAPKVLSAAWFGAPQDRRRVFVIGLRKDLKRSFEFPKPTHSIPGEQASVEVLKAPSCFEAISDLPDIDVIDSTVDSDVIPYSLCSRPSGRFAALLRGLEFDANDYSLPRPDWNPYQIDSCLRTIHADYVTKRLKSTREGVLDKKSGKTRLVRDSVSHTLRAGTKGEKGSHTAVRPVHYEYDRVISVREGARLMGFPDWLKLHRTKWHGFRLVGNAVPAPLGRALAASIAKQINS